MMGVPEAIKNRLAELDREIDAHEEAIRLLERDLAAKRAWFGRLWAQREDIDLCIAAIENAAKTPNAEAGDGEDGAMATQQATQAESAPVGVSIRFLERDLAAQRVVAKKPRAPKRDIRGMVMDDVKTQPGQTTRQLAAALALPLRSVEKAVSYLERAGRVRWINGVVMLRENVPIEAVHGILKEDDDSTFGGPIMIDSIVEGEVEAECDKEAAE